MRWGLLVGAGATILAAAVLVLALRSSEPPPRDRGAPALYGQHCAVCHGESGKGDGPGARMIGQPLRDFTDPQAMRQVSDRYLFEIIQKGGSQFGRSNAMPAWGMKLGDDEIRSLVAYIRSLARAQEAP
jgi:mono/diheme cytochrome c family protein